MGGTGFIGKHLNIALHNSGIGSVCFSRNPDLEFLEKYTPNSTALQIDALFQEQQIDVIRSAASVVYLASATFPGMEGNSVENEMAKNIQPAIKVFDYAIKLNPKLRLVYVSSGGTVYGPGHTEPIQESQTLNPVTHYAFGKIAIENYLKLLGNSKGINFSILRASNPVGKWHKNPMQGFIGASIHRLKSGQPIGIFGSGEIIRDYIDADELCVAIIKLTSSENSQSQQIVNVGSGVGTSLNQIVDAIRDVSKMNFDVDYAPSRTTDLQYNVLDCSKMKSQAGWEATLNITGLVRKMWALHQ